MNRVVLSSAFLLAAASAAFASGKLIAIDSSRAIFEVDRFTGAKTQIGTASTNASTTAGLAYDPYLTEDLSHVNRQ
jgi:hypothetical protein